MLVMKILFEKKKTNQGYLSPSVGHTFGAGAFLALACDYRIMRSDRGWLCWPEAELNMKFQEPSLELIRLEHSLHKLYT